MKEQFHNPNIAQEAEKNRAGFKTGSLIINPAELAARALCRAMLIISDDYTNVLVGFPINCFTGILRKK
jgi:hypothetical protein